MANINIQIEDYPENLKLQKLAEMIIRLNKENMKMRSALVKCKQALADWQNNKIQTTEDILSLIDQVRKAILHESN